MKLKTELRALLQILAFLIALCVLFGYSILPSTAAFNDLYLPLIGRFWPTEQSPLLITEILNNPIGEDPAPEWIELYNRGSEPLILFDYKVGDSETQGDSEGMYHFPKDTEIDPGQVIVIANRATHFVQAYGFSPNFEFINSDPSVPDMAKYRDWAGGSINLSNSGDEVLVMSPDDDLIDSVSWGNSTFSFDPALAILAEGHSWERKPADQDTNHAGDWQDQPIPRPGVVDLVPPTPTATLTPTVTDLPCDVAKLLITEVMYDSEDVTDPKGEWIEIFNWGDSDANLACVSIGDEETNGGGEGMLIFPPGSSIQAGEVIILAKLANQGEDFKTVYGFYPDYEIYDTQLAVPDMVKYSSWGTGSVNLSNSGDDVFLMDASLDLVDAVSWGSSDFAFNPSVPLVAEGNSIERRPADQDTNSSHDWMEQVNPNPGDIYLVSDLDTQTPTPTRTGTISPIPTRTKTPTLSQTLIPCSAATLLITEVMYHSQDTSDPDGEWFEIFNYGFGDVNLGCVKIGDEETFGGGEGMLIFPSGSQISPGEIILISRQATSFSSVYKFKPDYEVVDSDASVPDMVKYSVWASGSVNLSNSGDDLLLLDGDDFVVDAVSWGSSSFAFDPSVPGVVEGHSLERRPADQDSDSADDWVEQINPDPGEINFSPPVHTPTPTNTPTSTTPPSGSGLVINEIHADPHSSLGDTNSDGVVGTSDDEFIEIVNDSSSPIDISDWEMGDAFGIRHVFPQGTIVVPDCAVLVFGGGDPGGSFGNSLFQIASSGRLGLNDHGDIIFLYNQNGNILASYTFGDEGGDDQSITRDPDIHGSEPLVKHSTATGSGFPKPQY
jgi:hypothetical protein